MEGIVKTFENEWVNFTYLLFGLFIMGLIAFFPETPAVKEIGNILIGVAVTKIKGT